MKKEAPEQTTVSGQCNCRRVEGIHERNCPANYDYDTARPQIHNLKMLAEIREVILRHSHNEALADNVMIYITAPSATLRNEASDSPALHNRNPV